MGETSPREFLRCSVATAAVIHGRSFVAAQSLPSNAAQSSPLKKGLVYSLLPKTLSHRERFKLAKDVGFEVVQAPTTPDETTAEELKVAADSAGVPARRSAVAWRKRVGFRNANSHTGYVLARDAWGHGYATEALTAIVAVACQLGVQRLYALCHPNHPASIHVLEKCGFVLENRLAGFADFPNLGSGQREDCLRYAQVPACKSSQINEPRSPPRSTSLPTFVDEPRASQKLTQKEQSEP